ncbi:metallo-beta-lactamase family protein [Strigomonas culicis]|uniref:Metallo-beta-lactamase family protein n=1 Tax=Strigomonas culicis TaxID=28005 RepID=S9UY51_9TRYP|nr:metallo-beta-lactamase family protein [Strigomonas culicis]|eukprot:EPY33768.1 metallo-beta-lactamase family protein [Strigomonas culicis]
MQKLPYGSTWSNREADGKFFKNIGSVVVQRPDGCRQFKWIFKHFTQGVPAPKDGYKAFGEQWHQQLSAATAVEDLRLRDPKSDHVFWLGHASSLLCLASGTNIIFDPIFSHRASPFTFAGPARKFAAPTKIDELPNIDIVTISHDHFDHMDEASLRKIYKRFPDVQFVVPLGIDKLLEELKIPTASIHALDWWEERRVKDVVVGCAPAQHWGKRSLLDRNSHLWCGWVVGWGEAVDAGAATGSFSATSPTATSAAASDAAEDVNGVIPGEPTVDWSAAKTFYFTGDTSYNEEMFRLIHRRFPRIDMAALPIGAYAPRWFMSGAHIDPENVSKVFNILQVRRAYGVHWGTFELADEPLDEPPQVLQEAKKAEGIDNDAFVCIRTGGSLSF